MAKILRALTILLALAAPPLFGAGCASENRQVVVRPVDERPNAAVRPAVPIDDERPWYEDAGEVAVIVLAGVLIIGGIVGSIFLISGL